MEVARMAAKTKKKVTKKKVKKRTYAKDKSKVIFFRINEAKYNKIIKLQKKRKHYNTSETCRDICDYYFENNKI